MIRWPIRLAAAILQGGGVIAYPTETVFGLGCDPENFQAIRRLLKIKQRPPHKGLILLASSSGMFAPFVEMNEKVMEVLETESDIPTTFLVTPAQGCPKWLTGRHETLAIRRSRHPIVMQLCEAFGGAIVSTSANLRGHPPIVQNMALRKVLGDLIDCIVPGRVDAKARPSRIIDLKTGIILREH
ncbi:MAG: threonylcarbamoyl-AMP synthase [Gammaproteobacteria bacterium]|nr:MAG: threonylcarbamoyl-AMP synthase [Gammaproteobacteria bacterium]